MDEDIKPALLVFGVSRGIPDPQSLRAAAYLTKRLGRELHGIFASDPALVAVEQYPLLKEFQWLERRWRSVEPSIIRSEHENLISFAERTLSSISQDIGVPARFATSPLREEEILSAVSSRDLVIVIEPGIALPGASVAFRNCVQAAMATAADLLFIPKHAVGQESPLRLVRPSTIDHLLTAASRSTPVLLTSDNAQGN